MLYYVLLGSPPFYRFYQAYYHAVCILGHRQRDGGKTSVTGTFPTQCHLDGEVLFVYGGYPWGDVPDNLGFEEAKSIRSRFKVFSPLRLPPVSDNPANQPIKK
jgi:hypothetical protein